MQRMSSMLSRSNTAAVRASTPLALLLMTGLVALGCSSSDEGGAGKGGAGGSPGTGGARAGGSGGSGTGGSSGSGGGSSGTGGSSAGQGGSGGGGGAGGGLGAGGAGGSAGGSGGSSDARAAETGGGGSGGGGGGADARADGSPAGGAFTLSSTAFAPRGLIPTKHRCTFEDISPPLSWTPGPPGTKSYAVTMRHMNSLHWTLFDVPVSVTSLPEKIERAAMPPIPAGSKQTKPNVDGSTWYGYAGSCPQGPNRLYDFAVHALKVDTLPGVTSESTIRAVYNAIMANQLGIATLVGTASPNGR